MLKFLKKKSDCCSIKIEEVKEECCSPDEMKACCPDGAKK